MKTIFGDELNINFKYASRQNQEKYLHQLEGLLEGLVVDDQVSIGEQKMLSQWRDSVAEYAHRAPYREIVEMLDDIFRDGIVDVEEVEDLKWLVNRYSRNSRVYKAVTADIQKLHGLMAGVLADGELTEDEIRGMADWLDDREHLRKTYPFEELYALILKVLEDGEIDVSERQLLTAYMLDLSPASENKVVEFIGLSVSDMNLQPLCAVNVDVELSGNTVCFTGKSDLFTRRSLKPLIEAEGGFFTDRLTQKVDYLVVGDEGNPCWAFAKYGRKIDLAREMRKRGSELLIIRDAEFVDSLGWEL